MSKLIILRGCPASGKSRFSTGQLLLSDRIRMVVNRDTLRRETHPTHKWPGYIFSRANEKEVTERQNSLTREYLNKGYEVISDNTNLNEKTVNSQKAIAEECGADFEIKDFFDVPLHKLIERNLQREHSVPESVIHDMYRKQLEIQGRIIEPSGGLPDCIICDLDGCICEKGPRGPFEWHRVGEDTPRADVIEVVEKLAKDYKVFFLTGRDGVCLPESREWVEKHVYMVQPVEIYSRSVDDCRPDMEIKEELLRKHVLPDYNVKIWFDDRAQVVNHARALGLQVFQVDAGRF